LTSLHDVSLGVVAALGATIGVVGNAAAADVQPTIVTLGDSYINGYRIAPVDGFAAVLKARLSADGHQVTIVEPGFRDTSRTGLVWLTKSKDGLALQANPEHHAVIVELGQNDCGRYDLPHTKANLDELVGILAGKDVPVLIVGTAAYDYCGADYAEPFSKMFSDLASKYGDLLYADFKDGVTGHPELLQEDADHPNAAGEAIVVDRMLPVVEALLAQVK
jgi:acyl-CoA thioesterase-1